MTDPFTQDFAGFTQDQLRPAIEMVAKRRRSGLLLAVAIAAVLFVVFALTVYIFLSPYRQMMGDHNISYWPLLFLAPGSLAMIGFSLIYILTLRHAVKEFRETLVTRIAAFIDPALVHENKHPLSDGEIDSGLLFVDQGEAVPGQDRFRGRAGAATVDICDIQLQPGKNSVTGLPLLTGLFFRARFERPFRSFAMILPAHTAASLSTLESKAGAGPLVRLDEPDNGWQFVAASADPSFIGDILDPAINARLRELRGRNIRLHLSLRGDTLYAAMLTASDRKELPGVFEGFDFGNCRDFCRDARLCMDIAREVGGKTTVWRNADA